MRLGLLLRPLRMPWPLPLRKHRNSEYSEDACAQTSKPSCEGGASGAFNTAGGERTLVPIGDACAWANSSRGRCIVRS